MFIYSKVYDNTFACDKINMMLRNVNVKCAKLKFLGRDKSQEDEEAWIRRIASGLEKNRIRLKVNVPTYGVKADKDE